MKLTVIGCGNMGSAIVRGLVNESSLFSAEEITVVDISVSSLKILQEFNPSIITSLANYDSVKESEIIILAVKSWLMKKVLEEVKNYLCCSKQIIISIAAGISIDELEQLLQRIGIEYFPPIFRVIPNTAVSVKAGISLIASRHASIKQEKLIFTLFSELGSAIFLDEKKISAGLAITSCGIAYYFKYIRAVISAGVELGFQPKEAQDLAVKTMFGAAVLLDKNGQSPEIEIDKVTTPGGLTIKGLNLLEKKGFVDAVIQAIKIGVSSNFF